MQKKCCMNKKFNKAWLNPSEWIHADDAAKLLKISKKTLTNYVCLEKIPPHAVRKGIGAKFFHKPTLMGLN